MKYVLIGNGINIQFGGTAYSNYFILERIKSKAKIGEYAKLFDNIHIILCQRIGFYLLKLSFYKMMVYLITKNYQFKDLKS